MKKLRKVLAVLLGTIVAASAVSASSVDALSYVADNPFETPEGYAPFDDAGLLSWAATWGAWNDSDIYKPFINAGGGYAVLVYCDFTYNYCEFEVQDTETFEMIYEDYKEILDFDVDMKPWNCRITMYDWLNENGEPTADPTEMEDKSKLIQDMTAEMYEAGCITEAIYMPYKAQELRGHHYRSFNAYLNTEDSAAEVENLQELVTEVLPEAKVTFHAGMEYEGDPTYFTISPVTVRESVDMMYKIQEVYPEATGTVGVFEATLGESSFEKIDLLADLNQPEIPEGITLGDVNGDGGVSVRDVLTIGKANAQMITLNETQMIAADCNVDGCVNADDLSVLMSFIIEKIDALPYVL